MKPVFFLLASILAGASTQAQQHAIDSSYANSHYRHRVALFRQMKDEPGEIIFLGNSLTEAGEWQELTGNIKVKNRGISGDVTYGILARLDEVVASKPAKIFLLTGTNDLKRGIPLDSIAHTFERLLWQIRAASPKTKVYLQSVFPVNDSLKGESYKNITNQHVVQLNALLRPLAARNGAVYVDVHRILVDASGQLDRAYTNDGIHLWPDAYSVWVAYLKKQQLL